MRIPTEHFTATPVFALSPISSSQSHQDQQLCRSPPPPPGKPMEFSSLTVSGLMQLQQQQQHSAGPRSLMPSGMPAREKKMSLPANAFNAFSPQSVGSAPNSPETSRKTSLNSDSNSSRKNSSDSVEVQQMSTISGQSVQPLQSSSSSDHPVAKNQEEDATVVLRSRASKYATLPRK